LALRLRREDQPIVFTNHTRYDIYSHYVNDMMPRSVQTFVEPIISPQKMLARRLTLRAARFANKCDAVIAPSHSVGRVLEEWGVTAPLVTIPNGVDLSRFENLPHSVERKTARAVWNISEDAPLALYVGRLAPEKNGRVLLESFALALRAIPDTKLLVVGNGPSNVEWKEWVRDFGIEQAVVFAGAMDSSQVPVLLSVADVFVSASVSEVHPLTFIEAMASGLPCVGTPSPGVCDMIKDDANGENFLTTKSDEVKPNGWIARDEPREFSQALIRALSQPEERVRRGSQAQRDSEEYAIEHTVSSVLELYQRVLTREVALTNSRNNS
jgi:glycosyltransferase involved in cell wall biosynthesis